MPIWEHPRIVNTPLEVVSYNVRADIPMDRLRGRGWRRRRDAVARILRRLHPDVAGLQEVRKRQRQDLEAALPEYAFIGRTRDSSARAEAVPLLVRRERLAIEDSGDFWVSPTPDLFGSRAWDTSRPRVCTWAVLRDRADDARFMVVNAHFDHQGERSRTEGARLVLERVAAIGLPAVVMGDLNAVPESSVLAAFTAGGLRDTLQTRGDEARSFHGFGTADRPLRIDYVLCDATWSVMDAKIEDAVPEALRASDHFPVSASLRPR